MKSLKGFFIKHIRDLILNLLFLKRTLVMILMLVSTNLASPCVSHAQEIEPRWVQFKQYEDSKYYYFTQKVFAPQIHCQSCFEEARKTALLEMVRTLFGTSQKFQVTSYESIVNYDLTIQSNEKLPLIKTKTFKERDRYYKPQQKELVVLFEFSKAEYEKLKKKNVDSNQGDLEELVAVSGRGGVGSLLVTSQPSGAEVFIDGLRWGETPLFLKNKLLAGVHELRLEHPDAETLIERMPTSVGKVEVFRVLKPSRMRIKINANLPDVKITIDGQYVGKTPVDFTMLAPKEGTNSYLISLDHEEALPYRQFIRYNKNEVFERTIQLNVKPSRVYVSCQYYPCQIQFDSQRYELEQPSYIQVPRGTILMGAFFMGFEGSYQNINIKGGENKILPMFKFTERTKTLVEPSRNLASVDSEPVVYESKTEFQKLVDNCEYKNNLIVKFEGNSIPEVFDFSPLVGYGYEGEFDSEKVGFGMGSVNLFLNEQDVEVNAISYGKFKFKLNKNFNFYFDSGIQNKTVNYPNTNVKYEFVQTFDQIGVQFLPNEWRQNKLRGYIDIGSMNFSSPFISKPNISVFQVTLGLEF
jgi:hypothetical protein